MLRKDIVEDVKAGKFHIWAIDHVTQAIQLLSEKKAGTFSKNKFTRGSVYEKARVNLEALREKNDKD